MKQAETKRSRNVSGNGARLRCARLTLETLFHGKWQASILWAMRGGSVRIGQLGRLIPGASKKVLVKSLRELEVNGVVVRKDLSDVVLHVEYELRAELRESVAALMDGLSDWGAHFLELESARASTAKNISTDAKLSEGRVESTNQL